MGVWPHVADEAVEMLQFQLTEPSTQGEGDAATAGLLKGTLGTCHQVTAGQILKPQVLAGASHPDMPPTRPGNGAPSTPWGNCALLAGVACPRVF